MVHRSYNQLGNQAKKTEKKNRRYKRTSHDRTSYNQGQNVSPHNLIYRVFGLRNHFILHELVHHEFIPEI